MFRKKMQISSKNDPKVTPKGLPKSSKNRSWGHLGGQDGPRMLQEGFRDPIWTILDRLWTDFGPMFDRIWTDIELNLDHISMKLRIDLRSFLF